MFVFLVDDEAVLTSVTVLVAVLALLSAPRGELARPHFCSEGGMLPLVTYGNEALRRTLTRQNLPPLLPLTLTLL